MLQSADEAQKVTGKQREVPGEKLMWEILCAAHLLWNRSSPDDASRSAQLRKRSPIKWVGAFPSPLYKDGISEIDEIRDLNRSEF